MTLQDIKDYLRVDGTDEDAVIESLIAAVKSEIRRRTGKTLAGTADIAADDLYCLSVKMGVADAYENRGSEVTGRTVSQYSRTFDRLVQFIGMSGDYQ